MTATTTQERFTRATRTGEEAMSTAIRGWGETMQTVLGMGTGQGAGRSPGQLIDVWFDVADGALSVQREFAKALLAAGEPVLDAMSRAAQHTAETTQEATEQAGRAARSGAARTAR
ncbi:hypothetical protein [Pseudonocardia sp. H11422]|uniref:hypothetical protein n=1 Tax=Pseudonocardia sp. H11422 TaxID=2835866 RepID=UPI001BDBF217|nr:hypothetical protein [Pseudonocardia sp. H11422]